jgi:transketolase
MRDAFVNTFLQLAESGHNIHLLTADLGFKVFDPIHEKYPDRFTNVGVAEANMIGIAAGMAMRGMKVFCYSIAPFVIFRTLDQIRADLCHMQLPVILVAGGGGLHYAMEGMTHHAIEDIAITRALPGLTVLAPGDPLECEVLMKGAIELEGPSYFRLGGNDNPVVYENSQRPKFGEISCLQPEGDIAIIANGEMLLRAKKAIELLKEEGVMCRLYSIHTLKPIDNHTIETIARECDCIVTLEEHNIINGIGTAVAETLFSFGYRGKFHKFGIPDEYAKELGDKEWLRDHYGLGHERVAFEIKRLLDDKDHKTNILHFPDVVRISSGL